MARKDVWHKPFLSGSYEQRIYGVKIGHVHQRETGDWVALFDGVVLGTYKTAEDARSRVDVVGEVC